MRGRTRRRGLQPRRGFALLGALWLMVMLSGLGLHVASVARTDRLAVANRVEALRARAGAQAGVERARARLGAIFELAESQSGVARSLLPILLDTALADTISLGDVRARVRMADAGAKLHLHRASADQLAALIIALGIDAGRADQVAQAIADWQDADQALHARGAERDAYLRAGARELPADRPLRDVDELRSVRGVDAALLSRLRPLLTVAGSGRVNPNTAPMPVLAALPGFTGEAIGTVLRLRGDGIWISSSEQLLAAMPSGARNALADASGRWMPWLVFDVQEIEFRSEAWLARSPVHEVIQGVFVRLGREIVATERRAW